MTDDHSDRFANRSWKYWTEPSFVEVDGRQTAYRRKGEGETVVYLHGGGNTRAWLPFHEELSQHFDVIAPEHPGYGDTERGDLQSWEDMVLHYDAFFRALGLTDFHLIGHSLGGWLASNIAVYYPSGSRPSPSSRRPDCCSRTSRPSTHSAGATTLPSTRS